MRSVDQTAKKINILFVDDEAMILMPLRAMFKKRYRVFTASSGKEALEILSHKPVDIIVSDQRMPEMNGTELLQEVKQTYPDIIRILLTGYAELSSVISSINVGEVYRFVEKPWKNNELIGVVDGAANAIQARNDLQKDPPKAMDGATQKSHAESGLFSDTQFDSEAICVIDEDGIAFQAITRGFPSNKNIHDFRNLQDGMSFLQKHPDTAVMILNLDTAGKMALYLLNQLREMNSHIVPIILTQQNDAHEVVKLINHAQVFRYLSKSLTAEVLVKNVRLALQRYRRLNKDPSLNLYTQVEALSVEEIPDTETTHIILSSMQQLKKAVSKIFGF